MLKSLDPRSFLKFSFLYTSYQYIVGGIRARRLFVENDTNIKSNQRVLDIGCGPGDILKFLPKVDYVGVDVDQKYIATAKKDYPEHTFLCTDVSSIDLESYGAFDYVIATGVLHHLDDEEVLALFQLAKKVLKKTGKLVTFDGCYTDTQSFMAKKFLDMDRGNFVRREAEYKGLASKVFNDVTTKMDESYFVIPYTSVIVTCGF